MNWKDVAAVAIFATTISVPVFATASAAKRLLRNRALTVDQLGDRGSVHVYAMPLMMGIIIFGCGAVLLGAATIPLLVWIVDGDSEARRAVIAMIVVFGCFSLLAFGLAWPGLRYWIAAEDEISVRRLGRERSLPYADITAVREARSLLGLTRVKGHNADETRIRIKLPHQMSGFDELVSVIRGKAPHIAFEDDGIGLPSTDAPPAFDSEPVALGSLGDEAVFAVPRWRTRTLIGFMAVLLAFFLAWPWPVVTGEHPIRDSFIFAAIGTGLWLILLLLVWQEWFQRRYPVELTLGPSEIRWRRLGRGWEARPRSELVSASVETDIRYVRGFPGYLYPLVITFAGGRETDRVEVDLARAKQMGTSTHSMVAEFRRRYFDPGRLAPHEKAASRGWLETAAGANRNDQPEAEISALERAIALYPSPDHLNRLCRVGDLQRHLGRHRLAVSAYRAHLDFSPTHASAWEGLAESLRALGRDDLAGEAIESAERILLRR